MGNKTAVNAFPSDANVCWLYFVCGLLVNGHQHSCSYSKEVNLSEIIIPKNPQGAQDPAVYFLSFDNRCVGFSLVELCAHSN